MYARSCGVLCEGVARLAGAEHDKRPAYPEGVGKRSNAQLVAAALAGGAEGRQAWDEIVAANSRAVWKVLWSFRLRAADRDDLFQATWMRALERLDQVREPDKLHVWLMTIARHECEGLLRRAGRTVPTDEPPERAQAAIDSERLEGDERYRIARAALERLGPECRDLIRLLTIEELTYREIEAVMGWAEGGTAIRRARCLQRVRRTPEVARYLRALNTVDGSGDR